jgi:predicted nucleic acid-binding Zn ribbon protein
VEAMQRIKSKTKKRKQSFTVLFIVPFALHFIFVLIEDKVELSHVIAHDT